MCFLLSWVKHVLMIPKDLLWKGIIDSLLEDFIRYFFRDYVRHIDFSAGFTSLDKELEQLFSNSESKKRHADKLIRAKLVTGEEQFFLVHVEVQGYPDPEFATRMFEYAYRIKDRYKKPLTALAIYTDRNRKYHFKEFYESFFGSEIIYRFNTFALIDYKIEEIRRPDNLFSFVIEAAYEDLLIKTKTDSDRLNFKIKLVKHLLKKEVDTEIIRKLLTFIKYYTSFEQKVFFRKFDQSILKITKSKSNMGIEEAILAYVEEKGKVEGIDLGIKMVIRRAWDKGLPIAEIADITNKSLTEVQVILNEFETIDSEGSTEEE